ncbi:MAG: ABC transporter permease [Ignavibacteriales bacterium]
MPVKEILIIAFVSLRTNKLRSSLTILGIVVGIFSIIAMGTVVTMLQSTIEEGVSVFGKNTFQIQKFPAVRTGGPSEWAKLRNRKDISLDDFNRLKEKFVEAKAVAASANMNGLIVKYKNYKTNPNISLAGVTPEAFITRDWTVEKGRALNQLDFERYSKNVVLGFDLAKTVFKDLDPIGQQVSIDGNKLTVIGVLEYEGEIFGQSRGNFAIIPLTTFHSIYGINKRSLNISVMAYDRNSYNDLMEKAEGYMRTIRKIPPGGDNDFDLVSSESILGQINSITSGVRIGALVIAAISLLAAGVGIMNIMLVSVTERTKEIGIRKSIGAKRKNILVQFLIEAIVLCLVGGVIGIVAGIMVGNLAGTLLNANMVIPIDWIVIGISLCVAIGVGFGTYPAYKAANLDPIEALRYE